VGRIEIFLEKDEPTQDLSFCTTPPPPRSLSAALAVANASPPPPQIFRTKTPYSPQDANRLFLFFLFLLICVVMVGLPSFFWSEGEEDRWVPFLSFPRPSFMYRCCRYPPSFPPATGRDRSVIGVSLFLSLFGRQGWVSDVFPFSLSRLWRQMKVVFSSPFSLSPAGMRCASPNDSWRKDVQAFFPFSLPPFPLFSISSL